MFDPSRKPRKPESVSQLLEERQDYFDPKSAEDGFTVQEAEALGWNVELFHAHKHFPGRGLIEVHSKDSDEGRYGVLQAIYGYELREHHIASVLYPRHERQSRASVRPSRRRRVDLA